MHEMELIHFTNTNWKPDKDQFIKWLDNRENILKPGLSPEPTIKILIFLALYDAGRACTYDDIREILYRRKVINGNIPDNTLRTSVLSLGKSLEKASHPLSLQTNRGIFQLVARNQKPPFTNKANQTLVLLDTHIQPEEIAESIIVKAKLAFHTLYYLEWSARLWESFTSSEAEVRQSYEANAWHTLGIKDRIFSHNSPTSINILGLATGEGFGEIELIRKIMHDCPELTIHYLAVDSSPRLLRNHIGLLKETFTAEIEAGQLVCAGVIANIFGNLRNSILRVQENFHSQNIFHENEIFFPETNTVLVTFFGNCLGNNHQDQETEIFSILHSVFQSQKLEILVGVSVTQQTPDLYKRNWDDFLLQTPRHLLEVKKLLKSMRPATSDALSEFALPKDLSDPERCPQVIPENYSASHQIQGQIYRFYYKLASDLTLNVPGKPHRALPKGSLILLYSIIKYHMPSLVSGIEKCGLFKMKYDPAYHQIVDTYNGKREYAVFCAYLEK